MRAVAPNHPIGCAQACLQVQEKARKRQTAACVVGEMQGDILNEEAGIEKGENARMASFVGAIAIADLVKYVFSRNAGFYTDCIRSTLGPKGIKSRPPQ